ncbi:alpha/beta fold hydrolase [Neobacillus mesonae]|uniref:alpha/beta fold hydrolase n=1 Tax=Neobacillus mesonae TaxID=1193713 RepID=UPI00203D0671|nr:alpha/beta hydrolase [Neobacillus mesonae]MCM3567243.1 alpha/beta hydrolase [Neobacillus mesonae]
MKDQTIVLRDGRKLGYSEYGNAKGKPIFFFHGTPGARNHPAAQIIESAVPFVRLFVVDRPGYGLSDPQKGRTLQDWNLDFSELLEHLNLSSFSIIAPSGGTPYAISISYFMPEKVEKTAILCGVGPVYIPELLEEMGEEEKSSIKAALYQPELLEAFVAKVKENPVQYVNSLVEKMPKESQQKLTPAVINGYTNLAIESSKTPYGMIDDGKIFGTPWNIPFEKIKVPIHFWHGDQDVNVPMSHAEYLSSKIPHAGLTRLEGLDHLTTTIHGLSPALNYLLE